MEKEKRMFSNTVLLGVSAVFGKVLSLFLLPFYTASLSPSAFGVVEIFVTTAVLLMPLFSFYAPQATFRFLAQGEKGAVRAGALLLAVGALLLVGIVPLLGRWDTLRPYRFLLYIYVCASLLRAFLAHILRAQGRFGVFALQQSFCALLTALFQLLFLSATELGVVGYLLGIVLGDGLTFLILAFCFFPFSKRTHGFEPALCGKMLRYALPLIPASLLWWTMGAAEKYFLLYYHGTAGMGLYAVAGRFPALIGFVTGIFLEVWHYAALQEKRGKESALFGHAYALMLPFALCAGVAVSVLSPILISCTLPDAYKEASRAVGFLSLGSVCAGLASFMDTVYTLRFRSIYSLLTAFLGACANVLLSFLLVPRYGIVGAAASGAVAFAGLFFLRLWHTSYMLDFPRRMRMVATSLGLLLVGSLLMAGGYFIFAALIFLAAPLPMAKLLGQGLLFLWRRTRIFLIHGIKRKGHKAS